MGAYSIRRQAVAAIVLVAGTLTACGDDAAPTTIAPAPSEPTTTTQVATTASTSATTTTTTTTIATGTLWLVLAPDGFLLMAPSGTITPLPFGSAQGDVLTVLEQILGAPAENGPGTAECPNGQDWVAVWPDTIVVGFRGGELLTWSVRPDSTLTDMAGIGIGSSRDELEAAWAVTVQDTSLGVEFSMAADGSWYGGVLSDSSPTSVVTNLWAGPACIFR